MDDAFDALFALFDVFDAFDQITLESLSRLYYYVIMSIKFNNKPDHSNIKVFCLLIQVHKQRGVRWSRSLEALVMNEIPKFWRGTRGYCLKSNPEVLFTYE